MTFDITSNPALPLGKELPQLSPALELQVRFKREAGRLLLFLPTEVNPQQLESQSSADWTELLHCLRYRINAGEQGWQPGTEVHLIAGNRLLDGRQLQEIAQILAQVELNLKRVQTSRRQTAVTAATAGYCVDQSAERMSLTQAPTEPSELLEDPLYLQMTLRSGIEIRHPGTVVISGDVNPGSLVMAHGDIIIWGRLRGTVHAGANGNLKSKVMALQMEPPLIRIADQVARGPEKQPTQFYPEVAYVTAQGIRISRASNVAKTKRWQV